MPSCLEIIRNIWLESHWWSRAVLWQHQWSWNVALDPIYHIILRTALIYISFICLSMTYLYAQNSFAICRRRSASTAVASSSNGHTSEKFVITTPLYYVNAGKLSFLSVWKALVHQLSKVGSADTNSREPAFFVLDQIKHPFCLLQADCQLRVQGSSVLHMYIRLFMTFSIWVLETSWQVAYFFLFHRWRLDEKLHLQHHIWGQHILP